MLFNATFNNISVILWQSVFLMNEEGSDSDSDYNPDVIEEMSLKRKRPMARKSTTPGRRGEFEIC
jgi:hypothetical protein